MHILGRLDPERAARLVVAILSAAVVAGCRPTTTAASYVPRARDITITTVPLLVKELGRTYPFLAKDFAKGGVLDGKEIYGFMPSSITVYAGDTLRLTFVNPEDDAHSFMLPDLTVGLPGQSVTHATYIARRAGIYAFTCSIPSHLPSMWGQLIVLEPGGGTGAQGP